MSSNISSLRPDNPNEGFIVAENPNRVFNTHTRKGTNPTPFLFYASLCGTCVCLCFCFRCSKVMVWKSTTSPVLILYSLYCLSPVGLGQHTGELIPWTIHTFDHPQKQHTYHQILSSRMWSQKDFQCLVSALLHLFMHLFAHLHWHAFRIVDMPTFSFASVAATVSLFHFIVQRHLTKATVVAETRSD